MLSQAFPTSNGLELTSSAFEKGGAIPSHYTCDGENINPPLTISGVPPGAASLVLIMDDPDVPKQLKPDGVFDHWVLFNIPPGTTQILAGQKDLPGVRGVSGRNMHYYTGPCPPPQYEPSEHRYFFRLYALDDELSLPEGATKEMVLDEMKRSDGHVIETAELMGKYKRQS